MTHPIKAAYLGPPASYSHQAALEYFKVSPVSTKITLHPYPTFPSIFSAVQTGEVDCGIVPVENSSNGSVVQVLDLFANRADEHGDVRIVAEHYLPVVHCLLWKQSASDYDLPEPELALNDLSLSGPADASEDYRDADGPSGPYGGITRLYTHPQAWGQCGVFLERCFKGVERVDVSSTSRAAEIVRAEADAPGKRGENVSAAIASRLAGGVNGLDVLAHGIQDQGDNVTRFLVLEKGGSKAVEVEREEGVNHKALISFMIEHARPGALADALAVFRGHAFNLTSIDTRPSRRRAWHYVFFVECEQVEGSAGEGVEGVLRDLGAVSESCRLLGRWRDELGRAGERVES